MDDEMRQLLAAWLDDEIAEEAMPLILKRLKADSRFRADFVAEILMLGQLKAVQASEPRWLKLDDAIGANSAEIEFEERVMQGLATAHKPRRHWPLLALAAALLLGGLLWMSRPRAPTAKFADGPGPESISDAVAVLSVLHAAKIPEGELAAGPLKLETGVVQIDFFSGVRMLLRGPADIDIRSSSEVYMASGEASCYVSELGRGFRILTADGEVIDLGTAFGIRVRPQQAAEVHVFEGEISVRPKNSTAATGFHADQAVRLGVDQLRPVAFAREGFPDAAEMADRTQARYTAWLAKSAALSADPDVLLHCTFEGQRAGDSELHNQATSKLRSSHGAIIGTHWDRGRWPMKSALHFRGGSDRVLFNVPGSHRQLTMLVWVRVDALPNLHQVLLLTQTARRWSINGHIQPEELAAADARRAPGDAFAMRWTLRKSGEANLNFLRGDVNGPVIGDGHRLQPILGAGELGQWHCLATAYDGVAGTVAYYVNGKSTIQPAKYQGPVHLDFMEMGNLSLLGVDASQRINYRFFGSFDEVLIAKRALSAAEIQDIYAIGRPE
jgi:hypothetical protein